MGGAGPVAQQDTPVLGHASRSTLLSAVCRSAGHVFATNAALSIEYRSVTSRRHDNALPGSKQRMLRCWIDVKTVHCFVPDCIQHSDTHTFCYLSLSQEPNVKQSLNYAKIMSYGCYFIFKASGFRRPVVLLIFRITVPVYLVC